MNLDEAYKNKIIERLAKKIADGLVNGQLTKEQAAEISSFILANIDNAKNNSELLAFLEEVSTKWSIFSDLLMAEKAQVVEEKTQEKVEEITGLIQENKIDEAIQVASDANKPTDLIKGGAI